MLACLLDIVAAREDKWLHDRATMYYVSSLMPRPHPRGEGLVMLGRFLGIHHL